jgi:hypothetical protein
VGGPFFADCRDRDINFCKRVTKLQNCFPDKLLLLSVLFYQCKTDGDAPCIFANYRLSFCIYFGLNLSSMDWKNEFWKHLCLLLVISNTHHFNRKLIYYNFFIVSNGIHENLLSKLQLSKNKSEAPKMNLQLSKNLLNSCVIFILLLYILYFCSKRSFVQL